MAQSYSAILQTLQESQENYQLSIIKLVEPIKSATERSSSTRKSDISVESLEAPTPASLQDDLVHYKELFSKLRFSYVEQVTKEKFIRAIVGDPPQIVDHQENVELEQQLAITKAQLKSQKNEVAEMIAELERHGRELSRKHETINLQTAQLRELPAKIEDLQASIERLKAAQAPGSNSLTNMPLDKTLNMVQEKDQENEDLDRQLEQLQNLLPRKTRELERLSAEIQPLEARRSATAASAREARKRKEAGLGGVGDDLEERGRWWQGVESGLQGMLRT